jgi:hypothetical protein
MFPYFLTANTTFTEISGRAGIASNPKVGKAQQEAAAWEYPA